MQDSYITSGADVKGVRGLSGTEFKDFEGCFIQRHWPEETFSRHHDKSFESAKGVPITKLIGGGGREEGGGKLLVRFFPLHLVCRSFSNPFFFTFIPCRKYFSSLFALQEYFPYPFPHY